MGAYLHRRRARRRTSSASTRSSRCCTSAAAQLAGTLSGGEQQMVAMGRALMSRPKLLLMDEPSMGLAPILVERSFEIIQQVHESGVAILVVEQNANVSLSIADRGYVLRPAGRARGQGRATCSSTRSCGRPTLAVSRRHAPGADPAPLPGLRAARLHQLLLAGRALGLRARGLRALPRRLGRARRAVGVLGRAARGGAREPFARLVNADADEIAVTTSVSAGVSALASGLRFGEGRDTIVVSDFEFPTIGQIWHAQERRGARVVHVPGRGRRDDPARALRGGDRRATALVAVTHVCFRNGARLDVEAVGAHRARARRARAARRLPGGRLAPDRRRARSASTSSPPASSSTCSARPGSASSTAGATLVQEVEPTRDRLVRRPRHLRDGHPRLLARSDRAPLRVRHAAGPVDLRGDRGDRADAGDRDRRDRGARARAERAPARRRRRARRPGRSTPRSPERRGALVCIPSTDVERARRRARCRGHRHLVARRQPAHLGALLQHGRGRPAPCSTCSRATASC